MKRIRAQLMNMVQGQRRFDVTIAGEINLDLILYGLPPHMPTERELLATGFKMTLGGSSAITAHNLALLGTRVGFATRVCDDEMGQFAMRRIGESGVDVSTSPGEREEGTGVTILLPHGAERHILTYPGTTAGLTCDDLPWTYLSASRHFHLSSLFLQSGLHAGLPELLRRLRSAGLTISLDTNDDPEDAWGGILHDVLGLIDVFLPNERELLRITGSDSLDKALVRMADTVPVIVVKCGSKGSVIQVDGRRQEVPGVRVTPVDTIGAGDSFNAGFLSAYLHGCSISEAARFGNVTGALSTLSFGGTEAWRNRQMRHRFFLENGAPDFILALSEPGGPAR